MKEEKRTRRKQKPRETLEERVHRHLRDIHSEITDDDIRSVKTGSETTTNERGSENKPENNTEAGNQQITPLGELSEGYD